MKHPGFPQHTLALLLFQALASPAIGDAQATAASPPTELAQMRYEQAERVIDALGRRPGRSGVEALRTALDHGLPDALANRALAALGQQGGSVAQSLLLDFTRHRRPGARQSAYEALAEHWSDATSRAALEAGLGDGHGSVRAHCAILLALHGSAESVPRLQQALDAGLMQAAPAIGNHGTPAQLEVFRARLDQYPSTAVQSAVEAALLRGDLPSATKVSLVQSLQQQGTAATQAFLQRMLRSRPWSRQPEVRIALMGALGNTGNDRKEQHP